MELPSLPLRRLASILAILCLLYSPGAAKALTKFRQFQRQCFTDFHPCVMFMDESNAYGCAQCGEDVRQATVLEFTQLQGLVRFIQSRSDPRVIMVPETLFFEEQAFNNLQTARNVVAVVVYQPGADPSPPPFPPLQQKYLSTDDWEPNRNYNFYPKMDPAATDSPRPKRNSIGTTFKQHLYPFNIFRVNTTTAEIIRKAATRFPGSSSEVADPPGTTEKSKKVSPTSPRYKIQSLGQMYSCPEGFEAPEAQQSDDNTDSSEPSSAEIIGRVTSKECLNNRTCLPIGGQSVWSALGWMDSSDAGTDRELLAISAPIDSIAFFPTLAPGAQAEILSLAVLMAVAEAVGEYSRLPSTTSPLKRTPIYFAWNAQSWGYAGSSRFLKDVRDFKCEKEEDTSEFKTGCQEPFMTSLKFQDLKGAKLKLLNIGQLAPQRNATAEEEEDMFYFQGEGDESSPKFFEERLRNQFRTNEAIKVNQGDRSLVPLDASQSFKMYQENPDMVTIASYKDNFTNLLYHSMYDCSRLFTDQETIHTVTELISKAVIEAAFEVEEADVKVNRATIDQVLVCMQESWEKCELAKEYLGDDYKLYKAESVTPSNYPGSFFPAPRVDMKPSEAAKVDLILRFFAYQNRYTMSEDECSETDDCKEFAKALNEENNPQKQSDIREAFCSKGKCVAAMAYRHNAFGPKLNAKDKIQSDFDYPTESKTSRQNDEEFPEEPGEAVWTESVWDPDLGICAFVEDTPLFGGLILGIGLFELFVSAIVVFFFDRAMFKIPGVADLAEVWGEGDPAV